MVAPTVAAADHERPHHPAAETVLCELHVRSTTMRHPDIPDALRGKYQCFTQADLNGLRGSGCDHAFADVQTGVASYMAWLALTS